MTGNVTVIFPRLGERNRGIGKLSVLRENIWRNGETNERVTKFGNIISETFLQWLAEKVNNNSSNGIVREFFFKMEHSILCSESGKSRWQELLKTSIDVLISQR